jgi:hypothetical protein
MERKSLSKKQSFKIQPPSIQPLIPIKIDHQYYDEAQEVNKFYNKYTKNPENQIINTFNDTTGKQTSTKKDVYKLLFESKDGDGDKNLIILFKNYIKKSNSEPIILNTVLETNYAEILSEQINTENNNKIAIFRYNLILYNINNFLNKFIELNPTVFTTGEDVSIKMSSFNNELTQNIDILKEKYNISNLILNSPQESLNTNYEYMKMYIPKLLKNKLTGGARKNPTSILPLKTSIKNSKSSIKSIKELKEMEKTDKFIEKFNNTNWETVLNNSKTVYYGFNTNQPTLIKNETTGLPKEYTLKNNHDKIKSYVDKCNDLQVLYIKKHIELFYIFKKMKYYIDLNVKINEIIKLLLDPDYLKKNQDKDKPINLPIIQIKELDKLLKSQTDISNYAKQTLKEEDDEEDVVEERERVEKEEIEKGREGELERIGVGGGREKNYNLHGGANAPVIDEDFILPKDLINNILMSNKSEETEKNLEVGQTIHITIKGEEGEEGEDKNDKIMMTVKDNENDDYTFNNILVSNGKDKKEIFNKITYVNIEKIKIEFIENIVNIDSFEMLQFIKRIQLLNTQSLNAILNPRGVNGGLQTIIDEYQANIEKYNTINIMKQKTETGWQSFSNNNTNEKYFDFTETEYPSQQPPTDDTEKIQLAIYKCYDLQILYLIKHLEVIEMFKMVYYFDDMLTKKIGVLLFILSLYEKYKINVKNAPLKVDIYKILTETPEMLKLQKKTAIDTATDTAMKGGSMMSLFSGKDKNPETSLQVYKTNMAIIEKNENKSELALDTFNKLQDKYNYSNTIDNKDSITIKFNILIDYFKKFKSKYDLESNNPNEYGYADKLLFIILKKYLLEVMSINSKTPQTPNEKDKKDKQFAKVYYDIEEYYVDMDISLSNVKKRRSPYGVVKIGQFSKDDFNIVDKMIPKFHNSIKHKYIDELEKDKIPSESSSSFPSKLPELYNNILTLKTKIEQIRKMNESDEVINGKINNLSDEYKKIFFGDNKTNNDKVTLNLNMDYISNAIEENKLFNNGNIPNEIQRFPKDYKLDFLNLLHQTYLSNEDNFKKLSSPTIDENDKMNFQYTLLQNLIKRVSYNGYTSEQKKETTKKPNQILIYITKAAYDALKLFLDVKQKQNEELKAKLLLEQRKRETETEQKRLDNLNQEKRQKKLLEEEEQRKREEEQRKREEEAEQRKREEAEKKLLEGKPIINDSETERKKKAKLENICEKIKFIIESYKSKKDNQSMIDELKATDTVFLPDYVIKDQKLKNMTKLDTFIEYIIENFGDKILENCMKVESEELRNITNENLENLFTIITGSALIFVNLKYDINQEGGDNTLLDIQDNTIKFKNNKCGDMNTYGKFEKIYPAVQNKNQYIFQSLFKNEIQASNKENIKAYKYDENTNPYNLFHTIDSGKNVVIFGFGFSGSGKTYTLIEGDKKNKERKDFSLLEYFIIEYQNKIESVDFVEIYPEANTIFSFDNSDIDNLFEPLNYNIIQNNKNNNYKKIIRNNENNINPNDVIKQINNINNLRINNLRILPTPNNPESSRSFLQITIKLKKKEDGSGGGQLVLFDMPGTENTVNIKKIMLGEKIFDKIEEYNSKNNYSIIINKNGDIQLQDYPSKIIGKQTLSLCDIIFEGNFFKNTKLCGEDHYYFGLEEKLKSQIDNFEISYIEFFKGYFNKIGKVKFINSVQQDNINLINAYNIIFKYFTLNITGFKNIGIQFENTDSSINETEKKTKANTNITNLGVEMALFFNKKTGKTIYDINKDEEIIFLKDSDFKDIYNNFINTYILKQNGNDYLYISIGEDKTYKIADKLVDQDYLLISEIFNVGKTFNDKNIAIFSNEKIINFGNFNQQSKVYKNDIKIKSTSSPLIKYILLIFQYLYDNILGNINIDIYQDKTQINEDDIIASFNKMNEEFKKYTKQFDLTQFNTFRRDFISKKEIYDNINIFYRASVYFIYKYIKFIVKQGDAIVTTLEHLKFFFLTRAGEIDKYNEKAITDGLPSKSFTIKANCINSENNKYNTKCNIENIFNNPQIYINPSTEKNGIEEKINIGDMTKYGLLQILQNLGGNETDILKLNMKKTKDINYYTPDLLTYNPVQKLTNTKSKFIMLAHINTATVNKEEKLVCKAVKDTLEYIDSISIVHSNLRGGYYNKKKFDMKALIKKQNKINIKHKNQRRISMKNISKKKRFFSSKTKKNKKIK